MGGVCTLTSELSTSRGSSGPPSLSTLACRQLDSLPRLPFFNCPYSITTYIEHDRAISNSRLSLKHSNNKSTALINETAINDLRVSVAEPWNHYQLLASSSILLETI